MKATVATPTILHADEEHDGLRTAVIFLLILAIVISYLLIRALLRLDALGAVRDYAVSLSCIGALPLALAVTAVAETWLKRVWHSGRNLTLDEGSILIRQPKQAEEQISWSANVTALYWTFGLKGYRRGGRERRLTSRHVCLACQLQQGDTRLIVHSYLPPKQAAAWLQDREMARRFHPISPADLYDTSFSSRLGAPTRPTIPNEVLTGKDGRYWLAERHRWSEGFELTEKDFAIFMEAVARWQSSHVAR